MSDERPRFRISTAQASMAIALASLATAMFQGYLNARNMATVTTDISRREAIRTCKETVEAWFEVKLRIGLMTGGGDDRGIVAVGIAAPERSIDAAVAINRFAALGTVLANVADLPEMRASYTALSGELTRIHAAARAEPGKPLAALFERAEGLFGRLNADCVRWSRGED